MLGAFTFGYVLGYPSPVVPELQDTYNISDHESSFFNSVSSLLAIAGPFVSHGLTKITTRKLSTFIISICGTVFWALLLVMNKKLLWFGIVLRGLLGVVMGAYSSIIPMYIVEIAPEGHTAFFGTLNNLGISIGLVVLYLLGNWLKWRVLTIIGACICALLACLIWFVKDSPVDTKVEDDNIDNLSSEKEVENKSGEEVKDNNSNESESSPDIKITEGKNSDAENPNPSSKKGICQKKYVKGLLIGCMFMVFQQFSGINGILTNLKTLFNKAGVKVNQGIASAISSSAQVITIFISSFFVEKFGRKPAWCISAGGVVIFLLLYGFSVKYNFGYVTPVAAIFGFLFFYGLGTGPIAWYIVPELFEADVRSAATSIASSVNWISSFVVIQIFSSLDEAIGTLLTVVIFAIISSLSLVFGIFCIYEPNRKNYCLRFNLVYNSNNADA
ncbi:major facilitator superfamily protein [Trichomonas vaginalis G3]|uniref:Major facilitator superfamily protein n=1 Tax=Trichomonas vaginalis (strain ATCC PRA-98 / G3) TaxID=412133 RepID=A2G655_TRIV3|nr:major facilitator superfamily transporter [Trichomonas vaginalis G3]EAX87371.1 major facilitator superfamily protein [Trichomonas vaginalis G3]KAI5537397.1 glucose import [Trichomonas vaginalis G3]|eukprot:XP_001300301.1 major facilitator superfamily transporter [Trichomonas vaginalis G3]